MNKLKYTCFICMLLLTCRTRAQYGIPKMYSGAQRSSVKIISGKIDSLINFKQINIIYNYSDMQVEGYSSEDAYIAQKTDELNANNHPEKAIEFKLAWTDARLQLYEPNFEKLFNKMGEQIGIYGTNYGTNGNVTLKVETFRTDPGINDERSKNPAYIDVRCTFYDENNKSIVCYFIKNSAGVKAANYRYDALPRISEAYAKAAKMLMLDITKKAEALKKQKGS